MIPSVHTASDVDAEHGRIVERHYTSLPIDNWITGIEQWDSAKSIVEVTRIHHVEEGDNRQETSYYLSSMDNHVADLSRVIRGHWQIESYHWVLDVTFKEDDSLIYAEDGAKNMALFNRMLVNMLKVNPLKDSIAGKRQRAAWDDNFRAKVLFG
ncbi:ISAs1 family transposase [Marinomonas sp. 2405UD68-3]|uniref:ISAs1 family transposase n=1 Tax=Marinomonas sp. 2405UD68-3 TaxID=3391835 RepID=UPI0039C9AE2B